MPYVETRSDFIEKHGRDCVLDSESGFWVFADGATLEQSEWGKGYEPPQNAHERFGLIALYWTLKEAEAEAAFEAYQLHLKREQAAMARERRPMYDVPKKLRRLEQLRDAVRTCRAKRQAATAKAERHEPAEVKRRKRLKEISDETVARSHIDFERALDRIKP